MNYDIFSFVADTIIKWYDQTFTAITTAIKPVSRLEVELMGILLAAKKETKGTLTTFANKHILPTHALLRILVETYIFLLWCLNVPANEKKTKSDEVYKRLRRWDYTRLKKDKALLENLPPTTEIESAIMKAETDIEKLQKNDIKELPNIKQLCHDLGRELEEVYVRLYMRYSRAVHLNRNITQKLVSIQNENEKPNTILYKDDIKPNGDELITIASISYDINKVIRDFYGRQSDIMQNEYKQLESKLAKT